MQHPKRHHFVPECYLKAWTDSTGSVAVRRRDSSTVHRPRPRNVALQTYLYGRDETATRIEGLFASLETDWQRLKARLVNGDSLDRSDRETISLFIAVQIVRLPEHFLKGEFAWRVIKHCNSTAPSRDDVAEYLSSVHLGFPPQEHEVEAAWTFASGIIEMYRNQENWNREKSIGVSLGIAVGKIAPFVNAITWRVEKCRKFNLMTTDRPVTYWTRPSSLDQVRGVGLSNAEEVWPPLDPQNLLVLSRMNAAAAQVQQVEPGRFNKVNEEVAARCDKVVIAAPHRAHALEKLDLKVHGPTLRFNLGPGLQRFPNGSQEKIAEVLHLWTPRY